MLQTHSMDPFREQSLHKDIFVIFQLFVAQGSMKKDT